MEHLRKCGQESNSIILAIGVCLVGQTVMNPPAKVGDLGSIPGLGRSPRGGHGNPFKYSCLENPHEQRSPTGYSPLGGRGMGAGEGHKESNMTDS